MLLGHTLVFYDDTSVFELWLHIKAIFLLLYSMKLMSTLNFTLFFVAICFSSAQDILSFHTWYSQSELSVFSTVNLYGQLFPHISASFFSICSMFLSEGSRF